MRKLTILRKKSFIASLMKVKIYITDESSNELIINGMKCKKLGEIGNGKEVDFIIEDNEAIIFAIIDKITKDYCNDSIKIEPGESDLYISGKNKLSPFKGNPFVFDK